MKPILIVTVVAAAVTVAVIQHRKLSDLKVETVRLEAVRTPPTSKRSGRASSSAEIPRQATPEQLELARETMVEALVSYQKRGTRLDPERMKQLFLAAGDFSGKDIATFIGLLGTDPRLAGLEGEAITDVCREIFSAAAPFAWKAYLEEHRDLPDWQNLFDSVVASCLRADGKRALAQFEEETARGNRDFASSSIRASVLRNLAASDPDKMLAMAALPDFAADPDALAHLGGGTASQLKKPDDHHRFLAALRRATGRNPDSSFLQTVRNDYIGAMRQQLQQWPLDSVQPLVDGEFTREEKQQFAEQVARRGDLENPSKWADWFLGIDLAEWDRKIEDGTQPAKHPLVSQVANWSRTDASAAAAWLEKVPPGDLRSKVVQAFAWTIADRDPDLAADYLDELPESTGKRNLLQKIGNASR